MKEQQSTLSKQQRIAIAVVCSIVLAAFSAWRSQSPDPSNEQAVLDVETHPVASAIGSATSFLLATPFFYWGLTVLERRRKLAKEKRSEAATNAAAEPRSKPELGDEEIWAAAIREYESSTRRDGLYAKLYASFEGDELKIKAAYLRTRVTEMMHEVQKK